MKKKSRYVLNFEPACPPLYREDIWTVDFKVDCTMTAYITKFSSTSKEEAEQKLKEFRSKE